MQTNSKIAVAGATGRVGRHVVDVLRERGYDVVPISRSEGVDVITGEGLDDALAAVGVIVDAATGPSPDQEAATEFFTTAARNLHAAGERAGARRLVMISIIGTDRFTSGYGAAKQAHERATLDGPVPARILRASQFHELVGQMIDWGRQGDVSYVPRMRTQPIAARAAAEAIADLATAADAELGPTPLSEVAGPREESLVELATLLAERRGDPDRIEAVGAADETERELNESGALLPGPGVPLAGPTFREWLESA
jgi:uncharacterized protein YbjT (DUF2867 family)